MKRDADNFVSSECLVSFGDRQPFQTGSLQLRLHLCCILVFVATSPGQIHLLFTGYISKWVLFWKLNHFRVPVLVIKTILSMDEKKMKKFFLERTIIFKVYILVI